MSYSDTLGANSQNKCKQLLAWSESGSFAPCLMPDDGSMESLRAFQQELKEQHPEISLTDEPILPFFFCDPKVLCDSIIDPADTSDDAKHKRDSIYGRLVGMFGQLIIGHTNCHIETEGLEVDDRSIAIKIGQSANFSFLAEKSQKLFDYLLRERIGLKEYEIDELQDDPRLKSSFEIPEPRIVVATSLGAVALNGAKAPESVHFNEICDGSQTLRGDDRRTWYMGNLC
jgi:hypothetical protein